MHRFRTAVGPVQKMDRLGLDSFPAGYHEIRVADMF
jgi:hypothetical protein